MTTLNRMQQFGHVAICAAFPFVVVLLVYPLAIFNRNTAEFGDGAALAPFFFATLGAVVFSAVLALAFIRAPNTGNAVAAVCLWFGLACILNDLVAPVRLTQAVGFDGMANVVSSSALLTIVDLVLVCALLAGIWVRRNAEVRRAGIPLIVTLVLLFSGPGLFKFFATKPPGGKGEDAKWISTPPAEPAQVDHPNVYHIILDGFRGSLFKAALAEAGLSESDFPGFTLFPKNRSNFDGTQTSTPVFLTGTLYHGGSFRSWHDSWNDSGIFPEVKTRLGTDIQAYSFGAYHQLTRWVRGRRIDAAAALHKNQNIIFHLALVRAAPPFARSRLFEHGLGEFSRWIIAGGTDSRMTPFDVLQKDEPGRPARGEYVFTHVYFPHGPFLVDRDGAPSRQASLLSQSAYALRRVAEFLKLLRQTGHFDDAVVVIHSDHGWGDQVPARENEVVPEKIQIEAWPRSRQELDNWTSALLLIKPSHASNPALVESPHPTQLLDLPATLYDLLKLPPLAPEGKSVFASDYPTDPERHIFTGFRRWGSQAKRQLWFGQDFSEGEFNHFVWTESGGLKVLPPLRVTWESSTPHPEAAAITPLAARRLQPTVIELSWPAAAARGEFEIQMARDSGDFATIGRGAGDAGRYVVGDVAADATYRFRARQSFNGEITEWSKIVTSPPQ